MLSINEIMTIDRLKRFQKSDQIALGELIHLLEKLDKGENKYIEFDFGSAVPCRCHSWRGSYNELALGYELTELNNDFNAGKIHTNDLLKELKSAVGKTFTGWKGGEFVMDEDTPIWVANSGYAGHTGIVGVHDDEWRLIILTAYCEF